MRTTSPTPGTAPGTDTPELRALRSIAQTPLGKTPTHLLLSAHAMQATAIAALDAAGALPHPQGAPVRLGQGEYATDHTPGFTAVRRDAGAGFLARLFGRRRVGDAQ